MYKTINDGIQSSKVFSVKPGVGYNIAIHASPTARDFFLSKIYLPFSFIFIVSKTTPEFLVLAVAIAGLCGRKKVVLLIVTDD